MKICIKCKIEKDESCFNFRNKIKNKLKPECRSCQKIYYKIYHKENKEKIIKKKKEYYEENKKQILKYKKEYRKENKEYILKKEKEYRSKNKEYYIKYKKENKNKILKNNKIYKKDNKEQIAKKDKEYREKNKEKINERRNKNRKKRIKNDPVLKLRHNTSSSANKGLKNRNSSKVGKSFFKFMGFTPKELMYHLMNHPQKEWWMNENNQGPYRLDKWDNNDPLTWTWSLDHIIPHSEFNYTNMDDPEFKKCWSLDNLRPLSSKQNLLDGVNRVRHK